MAQITWRINSQLLPNFTLPDLNFLVSELREGKGLSIKDTPRRTVKKFDLNGKGVFYVKHTKIIGLSTTWKYFLLRRKILTEWRIMNRFVDVGVPTASPVALGIHRRGGFLQEAFFITQSLGETITLRQFYNQNIRTDLEKGQFMEKLASYLHFLHQKGVLHHDIHIENIIIPADKSHPLSFHLIDLYKARLKRNLSEKKKLLNLAQLLFATYKLRIFSREEIEKFLRLYYAEDSLPEKKLNLIIEKIFLKIERLAEEEFRS